MVDYKRILGLRAEGVSQRGIAEVLGCSRNTVAAVCAAADGAGVGYEEVADLGADEVRHILLPAPITPVSTRARPDYEHVHRELQRPSVTMLLLWNEYVATCRANDTVPYRYSYFNEQYRRWAATTSATMRIQRSPGESIEVDWAGDPMLYADPVNGTPTRAWLFVAALSYSAYTYVEAFTDMTLASWITGHVHAFEAFGGTARLVVPDNLRTGVAAADRYEPALNPTYAQLAEHYGTAIIPARVRRPRDKPVVEGSVRFIANRVAATLRDRHFIGLAELNDAITGEVADLNARPFQKREDSRYLVYARDERPVLNPLPSTAFELAELRTAKVAANYHVMVEHNFYSVPSTLIGQVVDVRVTATVVDFFSGSERVASHTRFAGVRGRYSTVSEHMPPAHRHHQASWTAQGFTDWATTIGPHTTAAITAILAAKPVVEQSYRSCQGVMSLARKTGGSARLEETCARALAATPAPSYTLIKKLWAVWQPAEPEPPAPLGDQGFVRGADYYAVGGRA